MESETRYQVKASGKTSSGIAAICAACLLCSAGLYLFARDSYSESQIHHLIDVAYNSQRPGGGRLSGSSYSQPANEDIQASLGKAQLLLLRCPDSDRKQTLQGLVYLASGSWQKYVDAFAHFSDKIRNEPAVLNNLGASYLGLSDGDPSNLLKALNQFERASQLDPNGAEPRFNLVVTYRRLRLHKLAEEAAQRYASIDRGSAWYSELLTANSPDKSALIEALRHAVETHNLPEAERVFGRDPDLFRNFAGQY